MSEADDHRCRLDERARQVDIYPSDRFSGRGILICAGGLRYFTNAYVCASVLRLTGCTLPIQFWHLGPAELTDEMRHLVSHLAVTTADAHVVRESYPARILNGWELKCYAIMHSPFEEVLFLDADNVAVRNPDYLFCAEPYVRTGAVFWPDRDRLSPDREIWDVTGVEYRDEREVESGQLLINKRQSWHALNVTMFMNEWSDYYYRFIHGDKETFHFGWRKVGQDYAMPDRGMEFLDDTMCQHDFDGARIFQQRNYRKWQLTERMCRSVRAHRESARLHVLPGGTRFQTHRSPERWLCRGRIGRVGAPLERRRPRRSAEADDLGRSRRAVRDGLRR
jgi:hypothetical protein